jgi:ankyrin repeat protein
MLLTNLEGNSIRNAHRKDICKAFADLNPKCTL